MQSAELFAGCGGLALGMSRAGFIHALMAELDDDAVATAKHNKERGVEHVAKWPVEKLDVQLIDWSKYDNLALISGGPPCQPFGIGGKKKGSTDTRNMWPEAIRAVREAAPEGFIFENVRNLAGPKFRPYLEWIRHHLALPNEVQQKSESYLSHLARLRKSEETPAYRVHWQVVNAADYGAPQIRHRVLVIGVKSSLCIEAEQMKPTHSRDRLLWDQYVTGDYWARHGLPKRRAPKLAQDQRRIAKLRKLEEAPAGLPWVTVRDCFKGLGNPNDERNHVLQPGARVYPGHTGSPLDLPSKALKAGDHGVPGGENMMVRDSGSVRYFTVREAARLVGLPDDYLFPRSCSWGESMRQLGNAVPAQLAEAAGRWLSEILQRRAAQT
ncbi:MAG: DNA (cytosine-5-)-methyltransferase [Gammaproteobacteria bacterium]